MVLIENFFIQYKFPPQYVYWGEGYMDLYLRSEKTKAYQKINTIDDISMASIFKSDFQNGFNELNKIDTGIILNSGQFIFNIFDFEKIPFQEKLKRDLVEWRLKKVFPENIDDYQHDYFQLSKTRIISVLIKKNLKDRIEDLFNANGVPLTLMGNSTVELINQMNPPNKKSPDFCIEIDKSLILAVFQSEKIPFYIRKFRSENTEDLLNEIIKTINFVKNSYNKNPQSFSMIIRQSDVDIRIVKNEMAKMGISSVDLLNTKKFAFSK